MRFVPGDPDDSEEEDDDEEDSGRPKKKTKKAAGRGAAAAGAGGAGGSAGDDDKEKGRRKIEIEYIQKKEKRHITFSKRKAGIMKKVRRDSPSISRVVPATRGSAPRLFGDL